MKPRCFLDTFLFCLHAQEISILSSLMIDGVLILPQPQRLALLDCNAAIAWECDTSQYLFWKFNNSSSFSKACQSGCLLQKVWMFKGWLPILADNVGSSINVECPVSRECYWTINSGLNGHGYPKVGHKSKQMSGFYWKLFIHVHFHGWFLGSVFSRNKKSLWQGKLQRQNEHKCIEDYFSQKVLYSAFLPNVL